MVTWIGLPDPVTTFTGDAGITLTPTLQNSMLYGLCFLHTVFNFANTFLLVWFIPQLEQAVTRIIPTPAGEGEVFRLKYIQSGPLSTAELSLDEAKLEIVHFGEICYKGFGYVRQAINEPDPAAFGKLQEKLIKYEEITDRIEFEIASYLGEVSKGEISAVSASRIKGMYKIIGEMESLGDSGEAIGRMLKRAHDHNKRFDEAMLKKLNRLMDLLDDAYKAMIENLDKRYSSLKDITNAQDAEYNINEYRNELREEHIVNIEKENYNYQTGVFYMDIVAELEKMGDFIINISEAQIEENEN